MNTLDIVLLILFVPGIIRGITKGFLGQAVALVGILISVWISSKFMGPVCGVLERYVTLPEAIMKVVAFLVILAAVSLVVLILAKLLTKLIELATLGWLNRILGMVLAIIVTAVVLGLIAILFDTLNTQLELVKSDILNTSVVYNLLKDFGYFIFPFLKQLVTATTTA